MTTTTSDTNLTQLVIHELTKAEYEALTPEANQLYLTPDESLTADDLKTVNGNSLVGSGNIVIDSLPSQTSQSGKFLTTNGTTASWASISAFTGADGTSAGTAGLVIAPAATDNTKFLKGDGTWDTPQALLIRDYTVGTNSGGPHVYVTVED